MTTAAPQSSQGWLSAELDRIHSMLAPGLGESHPPSAPAAAPADDSTPMQRLQAMFGLTGFERDLLLVCAGVELEGRFGQACGAAHADPRMPWPTFGLAVSLLPDPHWSAIGRGRPLRYWRLVQVSALEPLMSAPLRIDERISHFLMGLPCIDERLEPLIRPLPVLGGASPCHVQCAGLASRYWSGSIVELSESKPLLLIGHHPSDQQLVMEEACRTVGRAAWAMSATDIPSAPGEREQLARLCNREALLARLAFYIRTGDIDSADAVRQVAAFTGLLRVPVAIEVRENSPFEQVDGVRISVPGLQYGDRKSHWAQSLGSASLRMNGQLDRIVEAFNFDTPTIRLAGAMVRDAAAQDPGVAADELAWSVCRRHARRGLENLARRIEPRSCREDLVLPAAQSDVLRQIVSQVRHRATVHRQWGFSEKFSRGLGVAALFTGGSGTGKTMAAEIISAELQRDLYQIDLSAAVSKYIGETEKNLRRIFDAADQSAAVLLFDEADALFGKRSEVRDSHDRYANLEISYLLQRVESYKGVAILTTNMENTIDAAFMRRIRFVVQFPFPDAAQRQAIWQRVFPPQAPLDRLDFARLAQLHISGGMIRNIATHAAFFAAEEASPIGMGHLLRAAKAEYAKVAKPLTTVETRGWT